MISLAEIPRTFFRVHLPIVNKFYFSQIFVIYSFYLRIMVKKRGGVPYLKTNLKFSWESATDLDNNELNEILLKLGSHLNEVGLSSQGTSDNVYSNSMPNRKRKLSPSDSEVSPLRKVVSPPPFPFRTSMVLWDWTVCSLECLQEMPYVLSSIHLH